MPPKKASKKAPKQPSLAQWAKVQSLSRKAAGYSLAAANAMARMPRKNSYLVDNSFCRQSVLIVSPPPFPRLLNKDMSDNSENTQRVRQQSAIEKIQVIIDSRPSIYSHPDIYKTYLDEEKILIQSIINSLETE